MKKFVNLILILILITILSSCQSVVPKKVSVIKANALQDELRKQADITVDTKVNVKDGRYIVKKGDSLWKISKLLLGSGAKWKELAEVNNIKPPYRIKEKQKLVINGVAKDSNKNDVFQYRTQKNRAFGVGERLVFAVRYFNVTAGYGILEVADMVDNNGRKAYKIQAVARTAPFFETFYRVKDTITSYFDVLGLFSWKYEKQLEEGGYRAYSSIEFDHVNGVGTKHTKETYKIPRYVQDVLSEFYYFRTQKFDSKGEMYMDVCSDTGTSYQILVKKLRKETVTIDAGTFDCIVVQPHLKYEGIFRQKGDVFIWVTDDENRMPVLVKSKIAIGTIDAVLTEARVVAAE